MSGVKVQINSREALERLIGGSSEIELELRNNIVQEFTKKHLKGLISDTLTDAQKTIITKEMEERIGKNKGNYWNPSYELKPEMKESLQRFADRYLEETFSGLVQKFVISNKISERLEKIIEERAEYITMQWTSGYIEKRIDERVKEKLKKVLGV